MESLDGHAVKFSLKHILNLGQYDILSRCDSFGEIPGQGEIFFLDRKILWTLKSNLVLFFEMSFAALYEIYFRGLWSEMPMDVFRQLSVTFPDCFVSGVGRCFSGNLYELQFLKRQKTAWFAIQVLY